MLKGTGKVKRIGTDWQIATDYGHVTGDATGIICFKCKCVRTLGITCVHSNAVTSSYKVRQLFYYKVWLRLLQGATGITKCDWGYYKVRQVLQSATIITKWESTNFLTPRAKFRRTFAQCERNFERAKIWPNEISSARNFRWSKFRQSTFGGH